MSEPARVDGVEAEPSPGRVSPDPSHPTTGAAIHEAGSGRWATPCAIGGSGRRIPGLRVPGTAAARRLLRDSSDPPRASN